MDVQIDMDGWKNTNVMDIYIYIYQNNCSNHLISVFDVY